MYSVRDDYGYCFLLASITWHVINVVSFFFPFNFMGSYGLVLSLTNSIGLGFVIHLT